MDAVDDCGVFPHVVRKGKMTVTQPREFQLTNLNSSPVYLWLSVASSLSISCHELYQFGGM